MNRAGRDLEDPEDTEDREDHKSGNLLKIAEDRSIEIR